MMTKRFSICWKISAFSVSKVIWCPSAYRLRVFLKKDATFDDVYSLYKFDSELRKLICSEIEKIEISIRTQLSLIMGEEAGIYWFEDAANFRDTGRHSVLLANLNSELRRCDDEAIVDFRRKYSNAFHQVGWHLRLVLSGHCPWYIDGLMPATPEER